MVDTKREAEFLLRARDLGTKKVFGDVKTAVDQVTQALEAQVAAAAKGEVSANDLRTTLRYLGEAQKTLAQDKSLIEYHARLGTQLDEAKAKAASAAEAHAKLAAELATVEKPTKTQEKALASLARAVEGADKKVVQLGASIASQEDKLEAAGVSVKNLAQAEQQLAAVSGEVSTAYNQVQVALDLYDVKLKEHRASLKASKDAAGQQKAALGEVEDAVRRVTAAEDEREALLRRANQGVSRIQQAREAAEAADAEAEALRRGAIGYQVFEAAARRASLAAKEAEELRAYQARGTEAVARVNAPPPPPPIRTSLPSSDVARNIRSIIDPAAGATATLAGLEQQVAKLDAELNASEGPVKDYQSAVLALQQAQRAVVEQAMLIDSFHTQEAAVAQVTAEYEAARAEVLRLGAAVEAATEPNRNLTTSLSRAEGALTTSEREMQRQIGTLTELRERLAGAGLEVSELSSAETRLEAVSRSTTAAMERMKAAQAGKTNPIGSFLGLKPYELQNLSYQINDVFTQLGSGASITQTLAQQGGQIAQLFPKAIGAIVTRIPEIAAAAAVLGSVALAFKRITDVTENEREFAAALTLTGQAVEANAHSMALAQRQLEDYGTKAKDAHAEIMEFASKGLDETQFERVGLAAKNMADVLGTKVPEASKQLAEAFSGGYDAIQKLDDAMDFLSVTEREHIKTLFDEGRASEARTEAFRIFEEHASDAAEKSRGPWKEAVHNLAEAWHNFLDWLGNTPPIKGAIYLLEKLAEAANKASQAMPGVTANGAPRFADDFDAGVRTMLGEARATDKRGLQAVGSVILNRAEQTGQTVSQVVTSPKQFESMNNPQDRARVMAIDKNTQVYKDAADILRRLLDGTLKRDRFTDFYSPGGQAARAGDGRQLVPNWARGQAGTDIGGNRFFSGIYKGSPAGPGTSVNPEMARLEQSRRQLVTDRELADARENGYTPSSLAARQQMTKQVGSVADIDKQIAAVDRRIDMIRAKAGDMVDEKNRKQIKVGKEVLDQIQDEITKREKLNDADKVRIAGQEAYERVLKGKDGIPGDNEDAQKARALAEQAELRKLALEHQKEAARLAREQSAEERRADAEFTRHLREVETGEKNIRTGLRALETEAAKTHTTSLDSRYAAIDLQFGQFQEKMQSAKDAGVKSLPGAAPGEPDQTLAQVQARAEAARDELKNQAKLQFFAESLADLDKTRLDTLKEISDRESSGAITQGAAYDEAVKKNGDLADKMKETARAALAFAISLRGAKPDPQLEAFIAKVQGTLSREGGVNSPKSAVAKFGSEELKGDEDQLNAIISRRNELVASYTRLVQLGSMTETDARAKSKAAYDEAAKSITPVIDQMRALLAIMQASGELEPGVFEQMSAHLDVLASEANYVDANFTKMKETMENSLVSSVVDGFNNVAESIGNLIVGSGSLSDVWTTLWQSGLRLVGNFAKAVADLLIQMLALQAIKSIPGISGMAKGLTGGPDMTKTIAASVALGLAGKQISQGGTKLIAGAGAWALVVIQLNAAADKLLAAAAAETAAKLIHGGGIVGRPGGQSRGGISPLAFVGAPRMHTGGIVGLKPDEQATILQKGEEVLDKNSPRNALNGGANSKGAKSSPVALRQVLAIGEDQIASAMQGSAGEETVMTHIRTNMPTIRQMLNE